jgi:NTE family protein
MLSDRLRALGLGQIVLVMQGGGALGAYQGGVFQALDEAGIVPDWVIGTSIGAINAGIIAGNRPENRLKQLQAFWHKVRRSGVSGWADMVPGWGQQVSNAMTMVGGVEGFFRPFAPAQAAAGPFGAMFAPRLTAETAGFYSTGPLEQTLAEVIDFEVLNAAATRLTVGAANVRTGEMQYFDSSREPLTIRHIMASGALPPAFPAVAIDGELYWDGGIVSNSPVEAVFDDSQRRNSIVFSVHVWRPSGPDPDTMVRVMSRQKDLQYASRAHTHIARQKQLHKMRHVVSELVKRLPPDVLDTPDAQALAAFACTTRMHVVRLVAPPLANEDHSKDIDFSAEGIRQRWEAGLGDTRRVLEQQPWLEEVDPLEGFILHETEAGRVLGAS